LTRTASQRLGEVRESSLVAELHNVTGAKFRDAAAVLSHMRASQVPPPGRRTQTPDRPSAKAIDRVASAA
jgi:hypothetical protein